VLELNFSQTLGTHRLQVAESLPASGITAVFGVSGAGKTSLINAISGLTRPEQGRIVLNDRVLYDAEKKSACRRKSAGSVMSSRMRACSRITTCWATCATAWRNPWPGSLTSWWRFWGSNSF
jgi:ABC-type branched-subunit amino acid transport system ATPase component